MSTSTSLTFVREDDFVECFIYPSHEDNLSDENLEETADIVNSIINDLSKDYIWHKDKFRVSTSSLKYFDANVPHLHGLVYYGDNVQDEWFIVAVLLELSKTIKGLAIRVIDSDGEFLLIEASDFLPKWVNADKCNGKVFLFDGKVHLIQHESASLKLLLEELRENPNKYCLSDQAFNCIRERITHFPHDITLLHRATVYVPIGVALLLQKRPDFISQAVLAFCNRNPLDNKVVKAMRYFPPEDRVYTSVLFTKFLYAMLVHNNFNPDHRTGWNLPPIRNVEHKAHMLGAKIACGFEILACNAKDTKTGSNNDEKWLKYLESLQTRGYFKNLLKSSKEYLDREEKAKSYYLEQIQNKSTYSTISDDIVNILQELGSQKDHLRKLQKLLPNEDDDSWMNVSQEELELTFEKRYGRSSLLTATNFKQISTTLNEFLEEKSDVEGIEIKETSKTKNIDFDPNEFQNHLHSLLDFAIPDDKWDSNSDMSDYGDEKDLEEDLENASADKFKLEQYLNEMDRELAKTTIMSSFEKKSQIEDEFDDIENFTPVDVDKNAVKYMIESYKSQLGGPGPAGNILSSVGMSTDAVNKIEENK